MNQLHKSDSAWMIAGILSFVAVLVSAVNIYSHLSHYTEPHLQRYIVRILIIVPVYSLGSWLSLHFVNKAIYFDTVRDCYEAYVIYSFLSLVISVVGGEENCVTGISRKPPLRHPWPFCFLPSVPLNAKFLRLCKQGTLQFVIVKPLMAILSLILLAFDSFYDEWYQITALVIYNVSYTVALYCLLLFYLAASDMMSHFNPVSKFFAVKSVVFATYWQSLFISSDLQAFLLCSEMVLFALLHAYAFSYKDFQHGIPDRSVLQNMKEVISVRDVLQDAYHNFMPSYQEYVLTSATDDQGTRRFETTTYLAGNLSAPIPSDIQYEINADFDSISLDDDDDDMLIGVEGYGPDSIANSKPSRALLNLKLKK